MARLGRLVLERLMRYYRFLSRLTARKPVKTVTSAQIAEALGAQGAILTESSPSCGVNFIKREGERVSGCGVAAALLSEHNLRLISSADGEAIARLADDSI